ncbi:ABC transporter ATP-binding protein [Hominifimenecus sp. rT4P-3]|uniref:ABC transporter ATP-binding protein n=1 Tax=Hominifimenecus sp. rT4P-3 TaxID=3242979 RepID=UPI003DA6C2AB
MKQDNILELKHLTIQYKTEDGVCRAVNGVDLQLKRGETLGLVGETGAGKTTIALGIMRLVPDPPGEITSGEILLDGEDILKVSDAAMRKIRGQKVSMIFQDPMTALNPIDTVGEQITEVVRLHNKKLSRAQAVQKACDTLEMVGIPAERYGEYPHQFSGGMKQRIVIAIALACSPELLIADEPTTALDVTIQAQVLDLMNELKEKIHTSMLLITHDLGVVAEMCEQVAIIYAGQVVEMGKAEEIYDHTGHPYTIGLFGSLPGVAGDAKRLTPIAGLMPDPANLPPGCKFAPRCNRCMERCKTEEPPLISIGENHQVRCFLFDKAGREGK